MLTVLCDICANHIKGSDVLQIKQVNKNEKSRKQGIYGNHGSLSAR